MARTDIISAAASSKSQEDDIPVDGYEAMEQEGAADSGGPVVTPRSKGSGPYETAAFHEGESQKQLKSFQHRQHQQIILDDCEPQVHVLRSQNLAGDIRSLGSFYKVC